MVGAIFRDRFLRSLPAGPSKGEDKVVGVLFLGGLPG